jgi:hypothetical protein
MNHFPILTRRINDDFNANIDALIAIKTEGPAISFLTSSLFLPQKLQRNLSLNNPIAKTSFAVRLRGI